MINREWLKEHKAKECQVIVAHNTRSFNSGKGNAPALLSLVYHDCGKRMSIGREVYKALGKPKNILISTLDTFLVIRDGGEKGYKLSATDKGKPILYNAEVVRSLLETFNLNLEGRSSISFFEGEYFEGNYYIKMVDSEEEDSDEEDLDADDTEEQETDAFSDEDEEEAEIASFWDDEDEEEDLEDDLCD